MLDYWSAIKCQNRPSDYTYRMKIGFLIHSMCICTSRGARKVANAVLSWDTNLQSKSSYFGGSGFKNWGDWYLEESKVLFDPANAVM